MASLSTMALLRGVVRCAACREPLLASLVYTCPQCDCVWRQPVLDKLVVGELMRVASFDRIARARTRAFNDLRGFSRDERYERSRARARARLHRWSWVEEAWFSWDEWSSPKQRRWVRTVMECAFAEPADAPFVLFRTGL